MCNYKTLAHTENGYIILCNSCRHYQLAFGTTAITFPPSDYTLFKRQVKYISAEDNYRNTEKQKCITLDLLCNCAMMVLNYDEFMKLNDLIGLASFSEAMESIFEEIKLQRE